MSTTTTRGATSSTLDRTIDESRPARDSNQSTERRRAASWSVLAVLLALMVVSSVAHLWALHGFLPVPDIDEPFFVRPAVHMAATGDPNPGWFGHPGSTVIYPVAAMIHVWDVIAHHGPILTSNPALTERFQDSPTEFYVIGRLWTIALSVGALPLLFLVGRRAFNTRVALVATAIWAVLPLPVHLGRMVRTDSAAVFFGLLALWLCLRLFDEPRIRWCVLAGAGVGLAVSSRYFMVALLPVLLAAAAIPHRRRPRVAVRSAAVALASAIAGFALSTPYFFLDWNTAIDSLQRENASRAGATGLSHVGNLRWYLGTAVPESLTWPLVALAAAGVVLILRRRQPRQLLLVAFCAIFLAGICASREHWIRWVIQILPVIVLFSAAAIDAITNRIARAIPRVSRTKIFVPVVLVVVTALLALHPLAVLNDVNHYDNGTRSVSGATRNAARDWMETHLRVGSRILGDRETLPLRGSHFDVDYGLNPGRHSLADYQVAGHQYLVVNSLRAGLFRFDAAHHPREAAFYQDVACSTRLVALFPRGALNVRDGWPIRIYRLDEQPKNVSGYFCTQQVNG